MNGEVLRNYIGHSFTVYTVAAFDGELYSTASVTELFKWGINDGVLRKKFHVVHDKQIHCLTHSSQFLFTGSFDTKVVQWNAISGGALSIYTGKKSLIRSVVSWKNIIMSGGDDAEIRMWDASTESVEPFAVIANNLDYLNTLHVFKDFLYYQDFTGNISQTLLTNFSVTRTLSGKILNRFSFI